MVVHGGFGSSRVKGREGGVAVVYGLDAQSQDCEITQYRSQYVELG